jgi:dihydropteroate synthase
MAIVNRTPDSFYKPGITWDETAAMERVHEVIGEGADLIDVGGVPAAPGSEVDAGGRSGGRRASSARCAPSIPTS